MYYATACRMGVQNCYGMSNGRAPARPNPWFWQETCCWRCDGSTGFSCCSCYKTWTSPSSNNQASISKTFDKPGSSLVGKRVARKFDEGLFFGSIKEYCPIGTVETADFEVWYVGYDDGDDADYAINIQAMLTLYETTEKSNDNWAIQQSTWINIYIYSKFLSTEFLYLNHNNRKNQKGSNVFSFKYTA